MVKIAASILAADFSCLEEEIKTVEEAGAEWLHLDIMDGHFVPNISLGSPVVKSLRQKTSLFFDVHLMVENPHLFLESFHEAGANLLTVHAESTPHLHRVIQQIKNLGLKAGVSLNPATPLEVLDHVLDELDLVLLMTVNPGFGGQEFIGSLLPKIRKLAELISNKKRNIELQVDGGINRQTAPLVVEAGATVLVAGSALFGNRNRKDLIQAFKLLPSRVKEV